jgi:hypothetical protein
MEDFCNLNTHYMAHTISPFGITNHNQKEGYFHILFILIAAVSIFSTSCKKDKQTLPPPEPGNPDITYIDLGNRVIHYTGQGVLLDLNGDNRTDVLFDLYRVGNAGERADKWWWTLVTTRETYLAIDTDNEIPLLSKGNLIPFENFNEYEWWVANEGNLMERKEFDDGRVTWSGRWLNVTKKYVAVSITIEGKRHNAWIEISTNSIAQTLTIHRAGISKIPEVAITAGT